MAKEEKEPKEQDEQAALLKQAAEGLAKAASDRENRSAILKEVEATLGKLKIVDFPDLAESPIVQAFLKSMGVDDLKPGEIRNKGTLAEREREATVQDYVREFGVETFIPMLTAPITINGVGPFYLKAGEEITVPKPHYWRYREVLYALKQADIHEKYLMGKSDTPPDHNWLTDEGAMVRAWSLQGEQIAGKRGGHIGVGPIAIPEEEQSA